MNADRFHRLLLIVLYTVGLGAALWLFVSGWPFYATALAERPHHPLFEAFRPSGAVGHGAGVVGSALLLLLFFYSARKRLKGWARLGSLKKWLDVHIWMGVVGPLLIVAHSTFKVGTLVAISFWSMVAVALSGVFGRYIYLQIPRDDDGRELGEQVLAGREADLRAELATAALGVDPGDLERVAARVERPAATVLGWVLDDLRWPLTAFALRGELRRAGAERPAEVLKLLRRRRLAARRRRTLGLARRLLHHWHVIHRPFAWIMLVFMFVHVAVTLLFGFRWIF